MRAERVVGGGVVEEVGEIGERNGRVEEERRRENNEGFVSNVENDRLLLFFLGARHLSGLGR